jgi:hypothetical protein
MRLAIDQEEFSKLIKDVKLKTFRDSNTPGISIDFSEDSIFSSSSTINDDLSSNQILELKLRKIIFRSTYQEQIIFLYLYPIIDPNFNLITSWINCYRDLKKKKTRHRHKKNNSYKKKQRLMIEFLSLIYKLDDLKLRDKIIKLRILKNLLKETSNYEVIERLDNYKLSRIVNRTLKRSDHYEIKPYSKIKNILEIDTNSFAIEITRQISNVFCNITPHELISITFDPNFDKSRNISYFVNQFNQFSKLVPSEILKSKKEEEQKFILHYFIDLAERLYKLGNFHHMMAIIAGLNHISIKRMTFLWTHNGYTFKLNNLENILNPCNNFKNCRDLIEKNKEKLTIVPYLGIFISDILHIHDSEKGIINTNKGKRCNFEKLESIFNIINKFKILQKKTDYHQDITIMYFLITLDIISDNNKLYNLSREIIRKRSKIINQVSRRVSFRH